MATPGPSTPSSSRTPAAQLQPPKKWLTRAPASYNKLPGTLFLNPERLVWKQDGVPQPAVNVKLDKAIAMFNSKSDAPSVRLKLSFTDNEKGFQFAFSPPDANPQAAEDALRRRQEFVQHLTPVINRNKTALSGSPAAGPGTPAASTPDRANTPSAAPAAQIGEENALRRSVLLKHPSLAALHAQLVLPGTLSEQEFWAGRSHLLAAERALTQQKRGRASQLVDPKPQTGEGGEVRIVVTPQLVHEIFEEFPVVGRAYSENVPNEMSESAFWARYFQSRLFNQNRASTRSSATQHVVKPDPIFDQYLSPEDDQPEPLHPLPEHVDALLDLGATEEDHEQPEDARDVTMQPGRERGILPLIRRFNVHSERLLQQALGDGEGGGAGKRRKLDDTGRFDPTEYYDEIVIDDLIDHHSSSGVQLDLLNAALFSSSTRAPASPTHPVRTPAESATLLRAFKTQPSNYLSTLHSLRPQRKPADAAFAQMTSTVRAQHLAHRHLPPIPAEFFRQMTTCQTAANEFLRQFWGAVLPPPTYLGDGAAGGGGRTLGMSNRERAQKAGKMAGYLQGTGEKVEALVREAEGEGVDPERVRAAFDPLMQAVEKALRLYGQRKRKGGATPAPAA